MFLVQVKHFVRLKGYGYESLFLKKIYVDKYLLKYLKSEE